MGDGPRNETARQKHRQLVKEVCGCTSVPLSVVASQASSITLAKQELGQENHFGWAVHDRTHADVEYERLRHQESFDPVKKHVVSKITDFDGNQKSPRSPQPGHSDLNQSSQLVERVHQAPERSRNEVARLRHRQQRKEEHCCTSISSKDSSVHIPRQELNEDNHFGWTVFSKAYGDPEFERLMQFHEKPDITGNEFQKKTYVLYMKEGTVVGRDSFPITEDTKSPFPIGDLLTEPPEERGRTIVSENTGKKTNLISELFFLPVKERTRSRSPKTGMSRQKMLGLLTDHPAAPLSKVEEGRNKVPESDKIAGDGYAKSAREMIAVKNKTENKNKRGTLRRYLRAGGDNSKKGNTGSEGLSVLPEVSGVINNEPTVVVGSSKQTDVSTSKRLISSEYLLETPSGANQYLYLSKRNVKNHFKSNY